MLSSLAFCHPMMVYKAGAKNIPGLVPRQIVISEHEMRLENYTRYPCHFLLYTYVTYMFPYTFEFTAFALFQSYKYKCPTKTTLNKTITILSGGVWQCKLKNTNRNPTNILQKQRSYVVLLDNAVEYQAYKVVLNLYHTKQ